jgi:methylase of polypeptide subunit release factors
MSSLLLHGAPVRFLSANDAPQPARLISVDDRLSAAKAKRLAGQHTGMVWHGDYHNARLLLAALGRRITDRRHRAPASPTEEFLRYRRDQAHRARTLGMLLLPLDPGFVIPLRRAPDLRRACAEVYDPLHAPAVVSLRELLGVAGAHEWHSRGVPVDALGGARVHPNYGVYAPTRSEYIDLVAAAPLPSRSNAIDVGTGTGVLAALLATRGIKRVVATDNDPAAVSCAERNMRALGLTGQVTVRLTDLFPPGRAPLVVCNPPWLPGPVNTRLDRAVYDPDGRMLDGFLTGLREHLEPAGEGWLVLSDLAERLGLRTRGELLDAIDDAGLRVLATSQTRPRHRRAADPDDPLHSARAAELVSLWRLAAR